MHQFSFLLTACVRWGEKYQELCTGLDWDFINQITATTKKLS
jgi:hypothetical protein